MYRTCPMPHKNLLLVMAVFFFESSTGYCCFLFRSCRRAPLIFNQKLQDVLELPLLVDANIRAGHF